MSSSRGVIVIANPQASPDGSRVNTRLWDHREGVSMADGSTAPGWTAALILRYPVAEVNPRSRESSAPLRAGSK